jgi:hypothetical protein
MTENFEGYLAKVSDDKKFWCHDGSAFSNIIDLAESLKNMTTETFNSHVSEGKNDFSSWVYDVVGDVSLAKNIATCKDTKSMQKKIKTRITYIKKKLAS